MKKFSMKKYDSLLKYASLLFVSAGAVSCVGEKEGSVEEKQEEKILTSTQKKQIEEKLEGFVKEYGLTGLSFSIAQKEGSLFEKAYGKATENTEFTTKTLSNLGSVSKLLTGFAVMKLVEEGKLNLDDSLVTYLPDFKPRTWGPDPQKITIRKMLSHTSGISSGSLIKHFSDFTTAPKNRYAGLREVANSLTLNYEVDTVHAYSNLAYGLLALVVENITKQNFDDYVKKSVLEPIGMTSSSFNYQKEFTDFYAMGFSSDQKWAPMTAMDASAAGDFKSSASEMAKFISAVLKSYHGDATGILKPQTLRSMFDLQDTKTKYEFENKQMISWYKIKNPRNSKVEYQAHAGANPPFLASVVLDAEHDVGVSIQINGFQKWADLETLNMEIHHIIHPVDAVEPPLHTSKYPQAEFDLEKFEKISGVYAITGGAGILGKKESQMSFSSPMGIFNLYYHTNEKFSLGMEGEGAPPSWALPEISVEEVDGKYALVQHQYGIKSLFGIKVLDLSIAEDLKPYLGTWEIAEQQEGPVKIKMLKLYEENGGYFMEINGSGKMLLGSRMEISTQSHEFYVQGYGRNMGEGVYPVTKDGKTYLHWAGTLFEKE